MMKRLVALFMAATLLGSSLMGMDDFGFSDPVQVAVVAREDGVQAGRPFLVAVELKMEEHWHSYWKNPGDAGLPTEIEWTLPEGFSVGQVQWPCPKRFANDMGVGYGYENDTYVIAEIIPPQNIASDQVQLGVRVDWMACYDACVPGQSSAEVSLPVIHTTPFVTEQWSEHVAHSEGLLPRQGLDVAVSESDGHWILSFAGDSHDIGGAYFFAEDGGIVDLEAEQALSCEGGRCELKLLASSDSISSLEELRGVLKLGNSESFTSWNVATPVLSQAAGETKASLSFGLALLLAFAGGMILNLMPCVLPVLSFKVMSFIQLANESRKEIFKHSFAFFWGIMISFWVLASVMLTLRSYGQSVGWGFQLQEPLFVGILAVLLFVFAMSLFGVFEFGTKLSALAGKGDVKNQRKKGGIIGSFFSGVLATAVATPCTGPFLGATLGFAVTLPTFSAMLIFTAMAAGLAIPYMVFAVFPSLLKYMPKPGAWMETFKQVMGFIIMATVLWMVWIFSALTASFAVFMLLVAFLCAAFASWIFGRWAAPVKKRSVRLTSTVIALALLGLSLHQVTVATRFSSGMGETLAHTPLAGGVRNTAKGHALWQPFSAEALEEYRAKGVPVFVDFTAKWCLICQANKVVLHSEEMAQKFAEMGVVTMVADWTRNDPAITQELKRFGRTGVPLYVIYGTDNAQEPKILPQMLTADIVSGSLNEMLDSTASHVAEN